MTDLESPLQRLIDGEMNARDRQAFLQHADDEPARWREIALAFVEHQRLREDFEGFFVTSEPAEPAPSNVIPLPTRQRTPWWTIAAGLMFMLGLGFLLGKQEFTEMPLAAAQIEPSDSDLTPLRVRVKTQANDGSPQTLELPAYDEEMLLQRAPQMQRDGWQVSWRTDVLTGQLGDGRRVIVPVSSPSAHYRGQ